MPTAGALWSPLLHLSIMGPKFLKKIKQHFTIEVGRDIFVTDCIEDSADSFAVEWIGQRRLPKVRLSDIGFVRRQEVLPSQGEGHIFN